MSVNDWFGNGKAWDLSDPTGSLGSLLASGSPPSKNRFKLKPTKKKGKVVYFTVDYKPGALPAVWKKVRLFPLGNTPVPQPSPALPAQPITQDIMTAVGGAQSHLKNHASTTERLEGEIDVNGERAALTLVQIPNAFQIPNESNEAFLCVFATFDASRPQLSNPDGTAGGHSVHP